MTHMLLQVERYELVARSVKELDEKTKQCIAAERERDEKTQEAERLKACLEGE